MGRPQNRKMKAQKRCCQLPKGEDIGHTYIFYSKHFFRYNLEEARLSIASLSLSSVTAQVGKQIGALSGMDISKAARRSPQNGEDKWKEPVQHQSLLHKKLYEKNAIIQMNTKSFFEVGSPVEID